MKPLKRYTPEDRERAVRLVLENRVTHHTQSAAIKTIAKSIGCNPESLRHWMRQIESDLSSRAELTLSERALLDALEAQSRELRRPKENLLTESLTVASFANIRANRRLLCCPPPEVGEGFLGYRLRLAEMNRCPNPKWIWSGRISSVTNIGGNAPNGNDPLVRLKDLTGYSIAYLSELLVWRNNVPPRFLNLHKPRICPLCLMERPICLRIWELSISVICAKHGVLLIDTCPQCRVPLHWRRTRVKYCDCGYDLSRATNIRANPNSRRLAYWIARAADDHGDGADQIRQQDIVLGATFPSLELPLIELMLSIIFIGGLSLHTLDKAFMKPRLVNMKEAIEIFDCAALTFSDWPQSFHASLGKRMEANHELCVRGITRTFGYMYKYLYTQCYSDHFNFLRAEFESFIQDRWIGCLNNKRASFLSAGVREKLRYVNAHIAARRLRISHMRVRELVEAKELSGVVMRFPSGRMYTYVEKTALAQIAGESRNVTYLYIAASTLGITKKRTKELIEAGLLSSKRSAPGDPRGVCHLLTSEIQTLLKTFTKDLPIIDAKAAPDGMVTLGKLLEHYIPYGRIWPLLAKALLTRQVCALGLLSGTCNLRGLVLDRKVAMSFVRNHQELPNYLTIKECASQLNLNQEAVSWLMKKGEIRFKRVDRGQMKLSVVSSREMLKAKRRFVSTRELALIKNDSTEKICAILKRSGIKPFVGPTTDGFHHQVFLRKEALQAISRLNG